MSDNAHNNGHKPIKRTASTKPEEKKPFAERHPKITTGILGTGLSVAVLATALSGNGNSPDATQSPTSANTRPPGTPAGQVSTTQTPIENHTPEAEANTAIPTASMTPDAPATSTHSAQKKATADANTTHAVATQTAAAATQTEVANSQATTTTKQTETANIVATTDAIGTITANLQATIDAPTATPTSTMTGDQRTATHEAIQTDSNATATARMEYSQTVRAGRKTPTPTATYVARASQTSGIEIEETPTPRR